MKKIIIPCVCLLVILLNILYLKVYCNPEENTKEHLEMELTFDTAINVIKAIDNHNYQMLSEYAHPEKGIVFTPFSYIDYDENLVFMPEQIMNFNSNVEIYNWGYYDQSPNLIKMNIEEYFNSFVYDNKYLNSTQIGINTFVRTGNSIENITDVFPDCIFVDFYDSGSKDYGGLDWSSLKIVMVKYDGSFKVVALVHSSYTL